MADVSTLPSVELGVLGPLQVRQGGAPVTIPGAKPRAILSMLGLHGGSVVSADTLVELLWGEDPPRTSAKALQTHISSLRRTLGDGFVLTAGAGWTLADTNAARYKSAARLGRHAAAAGDTSQAVARFEEALALWRGIPKLPDGRRGTSEKTRWIEGHAALVEDRADALLATGRAAEHIGELEAAVTDAPLRERRWGQLMLALNRAGRQGEALGAYQRARALLAEELGVDPGPDLRRLEAAIVAQDSALEIPAVQQLSSVTRAVTFLLTDIEGSTAAWEADAEAMAVALARHDELIEQVVTSRGGRLIKTRGEGDATFSVFERPSAGAAARTWSVIARQCAAFNRHEPPAADWVTIDHRQLAVIDASDPQSAMAIWDSTPNFKIHIEAVHRLSSFGAVATYAAHGTPEGLDAEWRVIQLLTVRGDRMDRCELFDEADLDAALARFDELTSPRPLLGSASE